MKEEYKVSLSDRNKKVYDLIEEHFKTCNMTSVVSAVGTGKSFLAMELINRNIDKKMLYLAPTKALLKDFKRNLLKEALPKEKVENLSIEQVNELVSKLYPNLDIKTYSWFHNNVTNNNLDNVDYDYIITDEYHHTGAEKWYISFNQYKSNHEKCKFLGLSATPQRKDNYKTIYDKDDIVYNYSLAEAIVDGVYEKVPLYVECNPEYLEIIIKGIEEIENNIEDSDEKRQLIKDYNNYIKRINFNDEIIKTFKKHIKKDSKVLYFCPRTDRNNEEPLIDRIIENTKQYFQSIDPNFRGYKTYYKYKDSEKEEEEFIAAKKDRLNVLYAVDKYKEGTRPGDELDTLIMGRGTWSMDLFVQMMGRILKTNGTTNEPIIIDLAGNINHYQELVDEIERIAKEKEASGKKLWNNYSSEEIVNKFKHKSEQIEEKELVNKIEKMLREKKQEEEILREKKQEEKNINLIQLVDEIESFCKEYGVFPIGRSTIIFFEKEREIFKKYNSLLKHIGFNANDFKYSEIKYDKKTTIGEKLTYLYKKYRRENVIIESIMGDFERNGIICLENNIRNPKTGEVKLFVPKKEWLKKSKFFEGKENFIYSNETDENGINYYDKLKKYYDEYEAKTVVFTMKMILQYCMEYKKWIPNNRNVTIGEYKENLNKFLIESKFFEGKEEFKYKDYVDEDGISYYDKLRECYIKYNLSKKNNIENNAEVYLYLIRKVDEIEAFCKEYGVFPIGRSTIIFFEKEREIFKKYNSLLKQIGFNTNDFKYSEVKYDKKTTIGEKLTYLYKKYRRENAIIESIMGDFERNGIICLENHIRNPKTGEVKLFVSKKKWLKESKFFEGKENFIYSNETDENGINYYDKLKKCYDEYEAKTVVFTMEMILQYCMEYKKWIPNDGNTTIGKYKENLNKFLIESKFFEGKEEFKYKDYVDEDGISYYDKLRECYIKYNLSKINNIENNAEVSLYIIRKVDEIEAFCNKYGVFPNDLTFNDTDSKEIQEEYNDLNYILKEIGFLDGKFKFKNLKYNDSISVFDKLKYLNSKYSTNTLIVNEIIKESNKQKKFILPKECVRDNNDKVIFNCDFKKWMLKANFFGEEKNSYLKNEYDEHGISLYDKLNNCYNNYKNETMLYVYNLIRNHYAKTKKWITGKDKIDDESFADIEKYLRSIKFYKGKEEFEFADLKDENDNSIYSELLRMYFFTYLENYNINEIISELEQFIEETGIFPPRNHNNYNYRKYADYIEKFNKFLNGLGFYNKEFSYYNVKLNNGEDFVETLLKLNKKYGYTNIATNYIIKTADDTKLFLPSDEYETINLTSTNKEHIHPLSYLKDKGYYLGREHSSLSKTYDENGETLFDKIKEKEEQYKRNTVLFLTKMISNYCKTRGHWLKNGYLKTNITEDSKIKLEEWLKENKYYEGKTEFLYSDISDDSGNNVYDIINAIEQKYRYNRKEIEDVEVVINETPNEKINNIKYTNLLNLLNDFLNEYGIWPYDVILNIINSKENKYEELKKIKQLRKGKIIIAEEEKEEYQVFIEIINSKYKKYSIQSKLNDSRDNSTLLDEFTISNKTNTKTISFYPWEILFNEIANNENESELITFDANNAILTLIEVQERIFEYVIENNDWIKDNDNLNNYLKAIRFYDGKEHFRYQSEEALKIYSNLQKIYMKYADNNQDEKNKCVLK